MAEFVIGFLSSAFIFGGLYAATRLNVERIRDQREHAYEQRDRAREDADAAEAKAGHLATLLRAAVLASALPAEDAYLMRLEADLDPDTHGYAQALAANDTTEEEG